MRYVRAYAGTLVAFLAVDAVWITFVIGKLYAAQAGELLLEKPNMLAALGFYVVYAAAIVALAIRPALAARSAGRAALDGAILGGISYGTFTITNYAVLKGWTTTLVATDIPWGAFLTAVAAVAGFYAAGGTRD